MEVFIAPLDWQPDQRTSIQPDVLVVRNEDIGAKNVTAPLVLAVEILSPSTKRKDLTLKRSKYQDVAVASFWVVDPEKPSFTAFDLVRGEYQKVAEVVGAESVDVVEPFPLQVTPATLVTR
jgi:Uma2 family endonuclease